MVEFFVGRGFIIEFSPKMAQLLFNEIILSEQKLSIKNLHNKETSNNDTKMVVAAYRYP